MYIKLIFDIVILVKVVLIIFQKIMYKTTDEGLKRK
jgi:hypothetical protein